MFLNSALLSGNLSIGAKLIMSGRLISILEIEGVGAKQRRARGEKGEAKKCNMSVFLLNFRE